MFSSSLTLQKVDAASWS